MDVIEIGRKIKTVRDIRNKTLDDVALEVGVAKSTIQRYEKGTIVTPKVPVLKAIASALNISFEWLTGKTDIIERDVHAIEKMTYREERLFNLMEYYVKLNKDGKDKVYNYIVALSFQPKYLKKEDADIQHFDTAESALEYLKTRNIAAYRGLNKKITSKDIMILANHIYEENEGL